MKTEHGSTAGQTLRKRRVLSGRSRQATAVIELAVCLPLLALLAFASLEGANMLFLRQAVVQSAYEAAKASARHKGSQSRGRELAEQVLAARRVTQSTVEFEPSNVDDLAAGTPFTVTVSVPGQQRSVVSLGPFNGVVVTATATMLKE